MAWWIRVLEIADKDGKGIGKFRLTATSDEDGGGPYGLCSHLHDTKDDAYNCPDATQESRKYG